MARYRIGCCIPGASFMPEGEAGTGKDALAVLVRGCRMITDAGFDYAEAGVGALMELTDAQLYRAREEKLPIEVCNSFIPSTCRIVADGACERGSSLYRYADEAMARMSSLGVRLVVFGSGAARRIPNGMSTAEGLSYIRRFLVMLAKLAGMYNMTVAIEPLRALECNAINDILSGARLASEINDPHVAYLADAFHMACGGESPDTLVKMVSLPAHIHVAEPYDRTCPGTHGGQYLTAFASALRRTRYAERVSVECGFTDFSGELALAYKFMNTHF